MTTHWVYLVNDRYESWGYFDPDGSRLAVIDFFMGTHAAHTSSSDHVWTLSRRLKEFHAGDVIWARATLPLAAFVGCGTVTSEPEEAEDGDGWTFHVEWDDFLCRHMAADPITGILEKHTQGVRKLTPSELSNLLAAVGADHSFSPQTDGTAPHDVTRRVESVIARQGQPLFRSRLMGAYGGRCAFTGTTVKEVLQAAHIHEYANSGNNSVRNGLLLRGDVHDLFDKGLMWVTEAMRVGVSSQLAGTEYEAFKGRKVRLPKDPSDHPDTGLLARHRTIARL